MAKEAATTLLDEKPGEWTRKAFTYALIIQIDIVDCPPQSDRIGAARFPFPDLTPAEAFSHVVLGTMATLQTSTATLSSVPQSDSRTCISLHVGKDAP
jgi:hypothetical protein